MLGLKGDKLRRLVGVLCADGFLQRRESALRGLDDEEHLSVLIHLALPTIGTHDPRNSVHARSQPLRDEGPRETLGHDIIWNCHEDDAGIRGRLHLHRPRIDRRRLSPKSRESSPLWD